MLDVFAEVACAYTGGACRSSAVLVLDHMIGLRYAECGDVQALDERGRFPRGQLLKLITCQTPPAVPVRSSW